MPSHTVLWIIGGGVVLWIAIAMAVVEYGHSLGFPYFPLLASVVLLGPVGPVGPAIVLLAVTVAAGPRRGKQ